MNDLLTKLILVTELWKFNSVLISDTLQEAPNYFHFCLLARIYVADLRFISPIYDFFFSVYELTFGENGRLAVGPIISFPTVICGASNRRT